MFKFLTYFVWTAGILFPFAGMAQTPEDALRYGYPLTGGTARSQAIGGAMGSLGGDLTAAHVNPAGIAFYKNKEWAISPHFGFLNNSFDYRSQNTGTKDRGMGYGTTGLVMGSPAIRGRKATGSAFSVTINQAANFNNTVRYQGNNNFSSWSEQYVEELVRNKASVNQAENNYIFGSSLAFWTYLVDTISDAGGKVIGYQSVVPLALSPTAKEGVKQTNQLETTGGAQEVAISFANNYSDRLYLGVSFGIPIFSYSKNQVYREDDISGNPNNDFAYFEYKEQYRTTGAGFNAKLGLIYKPADRVRLGLAFHTPTLYSLSDRISSSMTSHTENYTIYPQPITKTSDELKGNTNAGNYRYSLSTPYRLLGSMSFVINEEKEVARQKGFVTADVEYVNYRGTRYQAEDPTNVDDVRYYNELNNLIKARYKPAFNIRVGGELKFKTVMTRLGVAQMGSPFASTEMTGKRTLLSGGLGYRNRGMFIDLTYVHAIMKMSHVPYWLADKPNTIADGRTNRGNIVLTVGFKFI